MTKGRIFILFSAGIIAGGGGVALLMNKLYEAPAKNEKKKVPVTENVTDESEVKARKIPIDSTGNYLDKKLPIAIKGDTSSDYYAHIDENSKVFDSLKAAESNAEISIRRDQLMASKKVRYKIINAQKDSPEDSTLQEITNIKTSKNNTVEVEFWQSPIHYKGYKLGKNKLVIYGIDPESEIMLFDLSDYVILQSGTGYYRLDRSSDFRNLKKFNDQQIIGLLK